MDEYGEDELDEMCIYCAGTGEVWVTENTFSGSSRDNTELDICMMCHGTGSVID